MMHAETSGEQQTPEEAKAAEDKESIAVVPLAIPLLSGPGAISTTIHLRGAESVARPPGRSSRVLPAGRAHDLDCAQGGDPDRKPARRIGINVVIRIMGLLLAAVAVEIFASGIVVLLPG